MLTRAAVLAEASEEAVEASQAPLVACLRTAAPAAWVRSRDPVRIDGDEGADHGQDPDGDERDAESEGPARRCGA